MSFLINPYIYATTSNFPTSGLQAYWKLDGNANDASGNSNNGTATNITYSSGNGKINSGAGFTAASSSKINVPDSASLSIAGTFTLNFWCKAASQPATNAYRCLIGKGNNNQFVFYYRDNGGTKAFENYIFADNTVTNFSKNYKPYTLTTGTWFMVTWVVIPANAIGSKFKIYINGSELGSYTNTNIGTGCSSIYDSTGALEMGVNAGTPTGFWDGAIDEVGIWNRELTTTEISNLYNSGTGLQP